MSAADSVVRLFSYGTLRHPAVQLATFGRTVDGAADVLPGFSMSMVAITDPDVIATSGETSHPIIRHTGDPADGIEGLVFEISQDELTAADRYEVSDYRRVAVCLRSGLDAFVYVDASLADEGPSSTAGGTSLASGEVDSSCAGTMGTR